MTNAGFSAYNHSREMCDPGPVLLAALLWPIVFPVNVITFIASLVVWKRNLWLIISSIVCVAGACTLTSLVYNQNHALDEDVLLGAVLAAVATISLFRQVMIKSRQRFVAMVVGVGLPVALGLCVVATEGFIRYANPKALAAGSLISFSGIGVIFLLVGLQTLLRLRQNENPEAAILPSNS